MRKLFFLRTLQTLLGFCVFTQKIQFQIYNTKDHFTGNNFWTLKNHSDFEVPKDRIYSFKEESNEKFYLQNSKFLALK